MKSALLVLALGLTLLIFCLAVMVAVLNEIAKSLRALGEAFLEFPESEPASPSPPKSDAGSQMAPEVLLMDTDKMRAFAHSEEER